MVVGEFARGGGEGELCLWVVGRVDFADHRRRGRRRLLAGACLPVAVRRGPHEQACEEDENAPPAHRSVMLHDAHPCRAICPEGKLRPAERLHGKATWTPVQSQNYGEKSVGECR